MNNVNTGKCLLSLILIRKGMTQVDLAVKTNIRPQQLSTYMNNKTVMSLPNARKIALALNCRIEDLYEWNEE